MRLGVSVLFTANEISVRQCLTFFSKLAKHGQNVASSLMNAAFVVFGSGAKQSQTSQTEKNGGTVGQWDSRAKGFFQITVDKAILSR